MMPAEMYNAFLAMRNDANKISMGAIGTAYNISKALDIADNFPFVSGEELAKIMENLGKSIRLMCDAIEAFNMHGEALSRGSGHE